MRMLRFSLAALLASAIAVGCNGDDNGTTGPSPSDLAGTWVASPQASGTSFVLTPNDDQFSPVDPVQVGAVITATVTANGSGDADGGLTLIIDFPEGIGLDDLSVSGTYQISGNTISIETPIGAVSGTFSLSENQLTIQLADVNLFDFDMDGTFVGDEDDEAQLDATFQRQE